MFSKSGLHKYLKPILYFSEKDIQCWITNAQLKSCWEEKMLL